MSGKPPPVPARSPIVIKKPAPPVTPQKLREQRKVTARLVRRLSEDSIRSPMGPDHVMIEYVDDEGKDAIKRVYVTEVNGTRTLDLYSGWNPDTETHKFPLTTLPAKVCTLSNLQRLWVSHNLLSSLPPDLGQLVSLRELFLHGNSFVEFPLPLCSLKSIEILWLSSNKINVIPDEIQQLKTLKRLHLDANQITELTPALCKLTGLEVLYLNKNKLETVSDDIGNMSGLKRLYLQDNNISEIPSGVCKLKSIKLLFLDDNKIRQMSNEFKTFKLQREANGARITLENNFSLHQSKLSIGNLTQLSLKARRHSDQHEQDLMSRRPLRVSLPGARQSESIPAELHLHYQSRPSYVSSDYKADTLPRTGAIKTRRSTFHAEH